MQRTNIYLAEDQLDQLDRRAKVLGRSRADVIRTILSRGLLGDGDDLDADLAAIEGSYGAMETVEIALPRTDGARAEHLRRLAER